MEIRQASRRGIPGTRLIPRLLIGAALALPSTLVLAHAARAAGVVTDCANYGSANGLGAALAAGGNISFNCSGTGPFTIVFPAQFDLTANVSIDGSDQGRKDVTLSGGNLVRLFGVHVFTTLSLANLTISNGQATKVAADGTNAGAIANLGGTLNLTNVTFSKNNSAGRGGAIVTMLDLDCFDPTPPAHPATCGIAPVYVGGTTNVTNSTFTQNTAATDAGALQVFGTDRGGTNTHGQIVTLNVNNSTFSANTATAGMGGAIFNYMGALNVTGSTFTGNTAGAAGGAIAEVNATATSGAAAVMLANSTLTNNSSTGTGGAIENVNGVLRITNSTINNNTATGNGGAIDQMALSTADVTISNTIIANNTAAPGTLNCNGVNAAEDGGNNLEFPAPTTCMFATNAQTGDPKLGPLASNGGPTQTEALLTGSAAVGKGSAATCAAAPIGGVDQRGLPRYEAIRGVCDIGAYDTGGGIVPPLTITGSIPLTTGVPARLGFAASNHGFFIAHGVAGVPSFNIGYITFQLGGSTFTVRQPVAITCTSAAGGLDHCLGTTGLVNGAPGFVAVPGAATLILAGTISSARGAYQQGQAATVTLSITVSAAGALTITKVTVAVAGNTVATWTALPSGTSLLLDLSAPLIV